MGSSGAFEVRQGSQAPESVAKPAVPARARMVRRVRQVGAVNDPAEREADSIASSVMRSLERRVTRDANADSGDGSDGAASRIRRSGAEGSLRPLQASQRSTSVIRRLAYNQNPTTWPAPGTLNRRRSGEGVAGVFFANDAGAVFAPGTVVIKPVSSSGEIAYANKFLSEGMGFDAPDQVAYAKGSPEGLALQAVLTTPGVVGIRKPTEAADQIATANQIAVMSMVQGKSIQTLDDGEAAEFLKNEVALEQVGRLMVSDAFLGNSDRLIGGKVNLGNFFYAAAGPLGRVKTIDNDSKFTQAQYDAKGRLDGDMAAKVRYIDQLTTVDGKQMWIGEFIKKMRQAHKNNATAMTELDTNVGWITSRVANGVDKALADIADIFTNNMDLVRAVGTIDDPNSTHKRHVSEAKGIAEYIKERQSGTDPKTALAKLTTYLEYRTKRDKFPKGFKWMTKVGMKRGFG